MSKRVQGESLRKNMNETWNKSFSLNFFFRKRMVLRKTVFRAFHLLSHVERPPVDYVVPSSPEHVQIYLINFQTRFSPKLNLT